MMDRIFGNKLGLGALGSTGTLYLAGGFIEYFKKF